MDSSSSSSPNNNKSIPDKPNPDPNQHPLNCPRCDSTNTKFCYYNNYSLSQPRHFCKACKRYWTRGGTLRNVPVGGGCRKNKKIKKPSPQPSCGSDGVSGNMISSSLVFSRPVEMNNFPFSSGFGSTTRVSLDHNPAVRFDHVQSEQQMMINGAGLLGFSSGLMDYYNQDPVLTGSSTNSTMATLLSSSLRHQNFVLKEAQANNDFQGLNNLPYDIGQNAGVKLEGQNNNNRFEQYWNQQQIHDRQQMNMINGSDSSAHLWNTNLGSCFDTSSNIMGSSVPSLI